MFSIFDKLKTSKTLPTGPVEYIIAGLGNPGRDYESTRHNAGFLAADKLADTANGKIDRIKYKSLVGDMMINGHRCLLIKPSTFMNLSGQALTEVISFYKLKPQNVIILYDDISLDVGDIRIRRKGSDGGHNGMKNIIYLSGVDTFLRIKIGVGKKPHEKYNLADWVLSRFTNDELKVLNGALEKTCESVKLMVDGQTDKAMNMYNS